MTPASLVPTLIICLYLPVALLVFWRFLPRLTVSSRLLALLFFAAQALVVGLALSLHDSDFYLRRLMNLDHEGNIPTAISSMQLAQVGAVALLSVWLARSKPLWQRAHLLGLGLVFVYLAWDEQFNRVRPYLSGWELYYALLGAAVAAGMLAAASRAEPRARAWHFLLLGGLAVSAAGSLVLEQLRHEALCRSLGFWRGKQCLIHMLEESLELLGIWLVLVAALGLLSQMAPRPGRFFTWLLWLAPFAWLAAIPAPEALRFLALPGFCLALVAALDLSSLAPRRLVPALRALIVCCAALWLLAQLPPHVRLVEYHLLSPRSSVDFEDGWSLRVQRIDQDKDLIAVQLFARLNNWRVYKSVGYSLHIVDPLSGRSLAGVDANASRVEPVPYVQLHEGEYIYKQRLTLPMPLETPVNRALWLVLTAWREYGQDYVRQRITDSDYALLDDSQLLLYEFALRAAQANSASAPIANFDDKLLLESADMPGIASPGETLAITFRWRSQADMVETYSQFLHFVHTESGAQWGHDQPPLGLRLPTRLWHAGLAESETWQVPVPRDLAAGTYQVYTGLYRLGDLRRLAAKDQDGKPFPDARVPLGTLIIADA